jgi:tetratricopeptide (TPR) repeat protein
MHDFPGTLHTRGHELDTLFPLNTVIAVREPLVTKIQLGFHSHLHVESPSDIIFLEDEDPLLEGVTWNTPHDLSRRVSLPVSEWKATGDRHFRDKEYFAAIAAYTYALQKDPSYIALLLNRCLAHLRLGNFMHALQDAKVVIDSNTANKEERTKALYRAAQAEYGGSHYSESKQWYQKCLEENPDLEDAKIGRNKCDARKKEAKHGYYDWVELLQGSFSRPYRPDVADFIGPVSIGASPNKERGRGLTATRNIAAGELLVRAYS